MHLLLTDRLTCPRCGPAFGLILRADRMENRVVHAGVLGCPNCRDRFPVADGFGDLRAPPRGPLAAGLVGTPSETPSGAETDETRSARVVALLGVTGGPGTVVLVGEPARHAAAVMAVSDELHVVAVDPDLRSWPESERVSRLAAAPGLPLFGRTMRGVAVDGRLGEPWIREAARVVAPKCRVVLVHAPDGGSETLKSEGLDVLAEEAGTVVAARG